MVIQKRMKVMKKTEKEKTKIKKILILSLGRGQYNFLEDRNRRNDDAYVFSEGTSVYRKANYRIEKEGGCTYNQEPYIAYPLMKETQPDEVIIIGTVQSTWSGLYLAFTDQAMDRDHRFENFKKLRLYDTGETFEEDGKVKKRAGYGLWTPSSVLDQIEEKIQGIFREDLLFSTLYEAGEKDRLPDIRVLILRYGTTQEQLEENYHRLARLREIFHNDGTEYEVSFDITHAFRSIPIYNLIILNYFKNLLVSNIQIKNVYYGNLEVSGENRNVATIVNLEDAIDVLDLTNGVSEFRNTGNAKTLLRSMPPEERDEYAAALQIFDHATQINDFRMIDSALQKLQEAFEKNNTKNKGNADALVHQRTKYEDYRSMVQQVIASELYGGEDLTYKDFSKKSMAQRRLQLAKWCMQQNRYGLATATGMEAMRSFLVVPYLRGRGELTESDRETWEKKCSDENHRRNAQAALERAVKAVKERRDAVQGKEINEETSSDKLNEEDKERNAAEARAIEELGELARKMWESSEKIRPIRNIFAHNLNEAALQGNDDEKQLQKLDMDQEDRIEEAFRECEEFLSILEEFGTRVEECSESAEILLRLKPTINREENPSKKNKPVQAFIIWQNDKLRKSVNHELLRRFIHLKTDQDYQSLQAQMPIYLYPDSLYGLKGFTANKKIVQYIYTQLGTETAIFYCGSEQGRNRADSLVDNTGIMTLLARLSASGFKEIYYVNVDELAWNPEAQKIPMKFGTEFIGDDVRNRIISEYQADDTTNKVFREAGRQSL